MFTACTQASYIRLCSSPALPVSFLSLFNIRMAEDEECVGGIHLELKKVDRNKRD